MLGKTRKLYSWDLQQHISLLFLGLYSNPALSANFPVIPSSSLHLCPLTDLSGSLLSSIPSPSLAGKIPGFKHPKLQSQPATAASKELLSDTFPCIQKPYKHKWPASRFTSCRIQGGNRLGPETLQCPHKAVTLLGQQHEHNTQERKRPCPEEQCLCPRDFCQKEWEGQAVHQTYLLQQRLLTWFWSSFKSNKALITTFG